MRGSSRRRGPRRRGTVETPGGGERRVMSASVRLSSEARIVSLMICQFGLVAQKLSCSQRIRAVALRDRDGALERRDDGRDRDLARRAREGIAPARAALGDEEAAVGELLQELADGGERQP